MKKKEAVKRNKQSPHQPKQGETQIFVADIRYAVAAAVLGFLLYANTIGNQYVLDDAAVISGNPYVMKGLKGIPALFTMDIWHFLNLNLGYYRPLSLVTFAIENQFFPGNPMVSHLNNVILFALTGFFLALLLMRVFKNQHPVFAFAVTALFLAHPIHTEVVANIKSRDEILSFLNLVIALFLFLKSVPYKSGEEISNWRVYLLRSVSCVFFYLALLSKETAMAGLFLVPLFLFFDQGYIPRQMVTATMPFFVLVILFQVQKYALIGSVTGVDAKDIVNYPYSDMSVRFPAVFTLFAWGVRLLIIPYPLSYNYAFDQIPATGWGSAVVIAGILLAVGLLFLTFRNIIRKPVLALGVIIMGITLAPAMAFVLLKGGIFAERFLYAPALGFTIILVWLLFDLINPSSFSQNTTFVEIGKKLKFSVPLLLVFVLFSFVTIQRNTNWYDNTTLYAHDVEVAPNSCQVHLHYGAGLLATATKEKDSLARGVILNKALEQLYEARKIYPGYAEATYDIGWTYQKFNINYDSAIYYLNLALLQAPKYSKACFSLATVYESLGKQQLASYYYNKGVEFNPYDIEGAQNRNRHQKVTGLDVNVFPSSENRDPVELSIPENQKDFAFYNKMGAIYGQKGDLENAVRCLEKALSLDPISAPALVNLSICYGMMKNYNKSIEVLNKMLELHPNDLQALHNLATSYEAVGDKVKMHECEAKIKALGGM